MIKKSGTYQRKSPLPIPYEVTLDLICVSTFLYMMNKLSRQGIRNRETVIVLWEC